MDKEDIKCLLYKALGKSLFLLYSYFYCNLNHWSVIRIFLTRYVLSMYLCREGYSTVKYLSGLVHIPLKLSEIVGSSRVQLTFGIDTLQIVGMGMSPPQENM